MWYVLGGFVIAIAAFIFGVAIGVGLEDKYDVKKNKK